jgi:molybdenum cofactor cytidylyltransferase
VFVTGLVLAAGGSRRLGVPKQLLPYRGATLLDSVLATARECAFDQLIVTVGGAAGQIREQVDLSSAEIVENSAFSTGCSSSIVTALGVVDPQSDGIVLMLGDQPGIEAATVQALVMRSAHTGCAVSRYDDGRGHPFWFGREMFGDLADLHGDKGIWKLIESGHHPVSEVRALGTIPLDVDDWDGYRALLAEGADR